MKVLLISPPLEQMFTQGQPRYYAEEQALLPPLGLLSLAGYLLEKAPEHEIHVLDMPLLKMDQAGLAAFLHGFSPDLVGLSCLTNLLVDTLQTAGTVKRVCPDVPVLLGGYHTQLFPLETLAQPHVDAVVLGAGEVPFHRLIQGLDATGKVPRVPGVITRPEELQDLASEIQTVENPDLLPFPARHLTPYRKYYAATSVASPSTLMMTSFGCPFRCIFCNTSRIQKIVTRSPQRMAEEFQACADMGIREIALLDENFTIHRTRAMDFAEELRRRDLGILWNIKSRVDHLDADLLGSLRAAGCRSIHFGVESGDPGVLKSIRKDITPDQVRRAFRLAREAGMGVTGSFMMGFPDEDRERIEKTISFALELDPDYVQFSIAIPLPGTDLYRMALDRGLYTHDHWRRFAENPTPDFRPPGWYEHFSREELEELLDSAYRRFYHRPRYILRRLRSLHSLSELMRNVQIGFRFLVQR